MLFFVTISICHGCRDADADLLRRHDTPLLIRCYAALSVAAILSYDALITRHAADAAAITTRHC